MTPAPQNEKTLSRDRVASHPPRVLFIAPQPFLEWRGSPLRVNFNVRALAELGYRVDLLVMPFGRTPDDLPAAVTVHRPRNLFGRPGIPIGPSAWKALYDVLLARKAAALARRHTYAVLHGVEEAGLIAGWLGRKRRTPVVYEKHSDTASYRQGFLRNRVMAVYARLDQWAVHLADAMVVTGPGLAEQARRRFPGKSIHPIFDLPSSQVEPDENEARRLRNQFAPDPGSRLAAYAGSFATYQGIDLLFAAIPGVVARFPEARFLIVGGTKQEIAQRRQALERHGVKDRVHFVGRVPPETLPHYLRAADVLLSPRGSGSNTPLKILDYMKAGRPIVATDCAANRILLTEEIALTPKPTADDFADCVAELMRDDPRRRRMGQAARRVIEERFSYARFRQLLSDCYREVGAGNA